MCVYDLWKSQEKIDLQRHFQSLLSYVEKITDIN